MATEAADQAIPTEDVVRAHALSAVLDVAVGLRTLALVASADLDDDPAAADERMHALRIMAEDLHARASLVARALDSAPGPAERLALLVGED